MEQLPYLDWDRAAAAAGKAVHPGPVLSRAEIGETVAELRAAAHRATGHVAEVSALPVPAETDVAVVDRPGWARAMAASARSLLAELGAPVRPTDSFQALRGATLGLQAGAVLTAIAPRILGQFDPFGQPNRLLLVAPNVVSIERQLGVVPSDFRLWVCLHEQTHRLQFGYAPWLRGHLIGLIAQLLDDSEPFERLRTGGAPHSVAELVIGPGQRGAFDQVTAIMSLVEGHADVMMDRVGTAVVPTLPAIRRAFERHRDRSGWSALLNKLLGMDLKRAQYRDGAEFCRRVLARAELDVLNLAFREPALLPSLAEVHDPEQWLRRVG